MTPCPVLLVADDDPVVRDFLAEVLVREGYQVRAVSGGAECVQLAETEPFDLALVDLRMPDLDGIDVLKRLATLQPGLPVLILTAFATMETAIEAIQAGAWDYLSKPLRVEEIEVTVRRALEVQRLVRENRQYREELRGRYRVENFVGQAPELLAIYKTVARVAALDTTVLIQGETGTGKEMIARAIHYAGPRGAGPFVVVDCTALPETLFESELFGHERGAFTGAVRTRRGLLETASGGTCFVDEVGELSPALQAKLLRVLQERVVRRVGGNETIPVDLRIIAATNRDLRKRVEEGEFREDLYYRLNVVTIRVPALRERQQDIPLLAQHFLSKYRQVSGKPLGGFARETLALLADHDWPGNVRELEHVVERAVALASSELILPENLPPEVRPAPAPPPEVPARWMTLEDLKRWYLERVLEHTDGNKQRAADILGIDRRTLYRMLEREGEDPEDE
jgi:two-component system, NtrC family, response regulator AtoC